ncbi:TRAP transporter substrate-binding protein [Pseudooceanicola sp. CBS1P-1]|uniref:ABC transporter substrate-binding protein n=1 Tax=Pseudooceanicola albus TaxID=2692189 RepID=A0A6L7G9X3_9RHOB|nr:MULTISPECIES: TRAP transporter substrate-binding protein [Pseudooceanicola]MBT9382880.1 TRAP transporter substrate-binding protein [Pseudooceanicola endophyticus]MXN20196.1 ABC transporter substrate-binding protein [Pseudooceanicola albus]
MGIFKTVAGAAVALGLSVAAAGAEELKFANFLAGGHPYTTGTFEPFAEMVKEKSGGDVTVRLYNGGELGPGPVEQYSRALDGVADLSVSLAGYTANTFPLTLVAELPGVLNEETGTQTLWDHIDMLKGEYRRVQLVSLWSSAKNYIFSKDKPVRTLDDVKGMKIRVPSRNTGLMVEAWGATPVSMPVSEIYNSLQTGVIDAAMIDGTGVNAFKLGEVSKYLTIGIDSTNSPFFILMNRDAFKSLSDKDQKAVLDAGREASQLGQDTQLRVAAEGIKAFAGMPGHEVITPTPDAAAAFNKASASIIPEVLKATKGAQDYYDALKAE